MKRILYFTNIEVPYKVKFFNELSKKTELTVIYERTASSNRDETWAKSVDANYKRVFLKGIKCGNENALSLGFIKYLRRSYDEIIISCINSPVQVLAILYMRFKKIKYTVSLDGEQFIEGNSIKNTLKKFIINGADKYYTAGEKSASTLSEIVDTDNIKPYYFSPMSEDELGEHAATENNREKYVLIVGQYFDYKGLDVAVKVAREDSSINYVFVGMGKRTELFVRELKVEDSNITVIPFLQKPELNKQYCKASVMLLPSKKECWGLVINEAASFGTPIVATEGSGAAVEFLKDNYPQYLKKNDDIKGLYLAIKDLLANENQQYSLFLKKKSSQYSIERMVEVHAE